LELILHRENNFLRLRSIDDKGLGMGKILTSPTLPEQTISIIQAAFHESLPWNVSRQAHTLPPRGLVVPLGQQGKDHPWLTVSDLRIFGSLCGNPNSIKIRFSCRYDEPDCEHATQEAEEWEKELWSDKPSIETRSRTRRRSDSDSALILGQSSSRRTLSL